MERIKAAQDFIDIKKRAKRPLYLSKTGLKIKKSNDLKRATIKTMCLFKNIESK